MEDRPTLNELLTHVDVGKEWLRLGVILELDMKDLTAIEHERLTIDQRLQHMYALWLETNPNATRGQLIKALGVIWANTLADKYKKWISSTGRSTATSKDTNRRRHSPSVSKQTTAQQSLGITDLQKVLNLLRETHFNGDWEGLGLELGLYQHPTLSNLQHTHDRGAALRECLAVWLQRADDVDKNGGANYVSLANAVERLGQRAVAGDIRRQCGIETAGEEAPPIGENTDNFDDLIEPDTLKKWFVDEKEGWIDLTLTRIHMVGPAGSGKTCAQNLLLNKPPPEHFEPPSPKSVFLIFFNALTSILLTALTLVPRLFLRLMYTSKSTSSSSSSSKSITDSTPIACKAVKVLKIASDGNETWKEITTKELLETLASSLKSAAAKFSQQKQALSPTQPSNEPVSGIHTHEEVSIDGVTQEAPQEPHDYGPLVKKMVDLLPIAKAQLSDEWAYIIDSGGQPAFQELLPVFTRAATLNIITLDLSKDLDDEFEYTYRINGDEFKCDEKMKFSNRKVFNSVISAASVHKPLNIPYQKKPSQKTIPKHSMSFVLGTHYDVVIENSKNEIEAEKKVKKMNDRLVSQLDPRSKKYVIQEGPIIFPVGTLIKDSNKRKEISQILLKKASRCNEASLKLKLPIRLFIFELCLEERADSNGGFVTREEAYNEGKRLHMKTSEVKTALTYLHNCTIILYYPDIEPHLVFVKPQRIFDVLSQLLTLTYVNKATAQKFVRDIYQDEMKTLKERGCFKEDLLAKFTVFTGKFQPNYFINLLKRCHVIAELRQGRDVEYFFPSALRSYNGSFEKSPPDRQPLCFVWRKQEACIVAKEFVNIPQGIFPLMIVSLLKRKECVVRLSSPDDVSQFRDAVSLLISFDKNDSDPHERLYIINCKKHIEVIFTGKKKLCSKINTLVQNVIEEVGNDINISIDDLHVAFACQRDNKDYCIVKKAKDHETVCHPDFSHTCTLDDTYWCWFHEIADPPQQQKIKDPETASDRLKKNQSIKQIYFILGTVINVVLLGLMIWKYINYELTAFNSLLIIGSLLSLLIAGVVEYFHHDNTVHVYVLTIPVGVAISFLLGKVLLEWQNYQFNSPLALTILLIAVQSVYLYDVKEPGFWKKHQYRICGVLVLLFIAAVRSGFVKKAAEQIMDHLEKLWPQFLQFLLKSILGM